MEERTKSGEAAHARAASPHAKHSSHSKQQPAFGQPSHGGISPTPKPEDCQWNIAHLRYHRYTSHFFTCNLKGHNSKSIRHCNTSFKCFVVLMNISFQMFVLNSCNGMMDIVHLKRRERGRRDDSGVATSLNYDVALSLTWLTQYVFLKWALRGLEGPQRLPPPF